MRKYYNYAIDLGTTNSCVSKFENGTTKVFRSIDGMEFIPSAVYVNKNGKIIVGRRAVEKSILEPEDTAFEFKRLMGVKHKQLFKTSGMELTPAELSAEVLKVLKEDVYRTNEDKFENVVITVPAAFNSIQCETTYEAAKLAGFSNIILLQEPIAAALAYGEDTDDDHVYLVFDFGGGTLDVAIVTIVDGALKVINHQGNNFLGGKDIDKAIAEKIILPELRKEYILNPEITNFPIYKKILKFAEEAKIAMSTSNEYRLDIFDIGSDDNGKEIDIQIPINIELVSEAARPIIIQCIKVAKKAVLDSKLESKKLDEILLVGGGTYFPPLRTELANQFSCPVNSSENPMTVVARGAALYASRMFVEDNYNINDVYVQVEYDNIVQGTSCNVIGKVKNFSVADAIKIIRGDKEWESEWQPLYENTFDMDLILKENSINNFKIFLRDFKGQEIIPSHNDFKILSKPNVVKPSAPLLPHTLSLEVDEGKETKLIIMIQKNNPIPARHIKKFKTMKDIMPESDDSLTIKLWEGESDNPNLCEWVGNLYITGRDIKYPIPKNTEIEIDVLVDISRLITINARIEYSDIFKSDKKLYNQGPLNINKPLDRIKSETKEMIDEIIQLKNAHKKVPYIVDKIDDLLSKAYDKSIQNHKLFNATPLDKDSIMQLLEEIKSLRVELELLKKEIMTNNVTENNAQNNSESYIERYGNVEDKERYKDLKESLDISKDENDIKGQEIYQKEMEDLSNEILLNNIEVWEDIFNKFKAHRSFFKNESEAEIWFSHGEEAIKRKDINRLIESVVRLGELFKDKDIGLASDQFLPPGIKRM
jgi:molecular chaperone DnaK